MVTVGLLSPGETQVFGAPKVPPQQRETPDPSQKSPQKNAAQALECGGPHWTPVLSGTPT